MDYRTLGAGQSCQIFVAARDGSRELILETRDILLEAPNWTVDGRALILNGDGLLWRLDLDTRELEQIVIHGIPALNNDHVLAPDGETVYLSANDWHIYRAPLSGGRAERITNDGIPAFHFLHGVSPDGETLAYIGLELEGENLWAKANVFTIPAAGGADTRVTDTTSPADGSEYSPDGESIYFNTEQFSTVPGHAQIARIRPDGTGVEQLTVDEEVNWFPRWAPDGTTAVYLSFPPGTEGHPADKHVRLKVVRAGHWSSRTSSPTCMAGRARSTSTAGRPRATDSLTSLTPSTGESTAPDRVERPSSLRGRGPFGVPVASLEIGGERTQKMR